MIEEILDSHGKRIVSEIQSNIVSSGQNATGETARSVTYSIESKTGKTTLTVTGGRKFFPAIETGSKPSSKKPSHEMIQSLKDWALAKGLEVSPWGVAVNILKHGSKLWQSGGRSDIYTNVKNSALQPILDDIRKYEKDRITKSLVNKL